MSKDSVSSLDENRRRYYLDVMGIQCWQLLEPEPEPGPEHQCSDKQQAADEIIDAAEPVANQEVNQEVNQAAGINWPQLETAVQQCDQCPLHKTSQRRLTGYGNQSAALMFVFLSPDSNSDADALFGKMLAAINIQKADVYITSLLKCAVPEKHTVSPQEIHACQHYLKQQIHLIKPELLVVLGETAARCLLQKNISLDDYRAMNKAIGSSSGQQLDSIPLFFSYSPHELLAQPDNKRKAWADLQQLQKML